MNTKTVSHAFFALEYYSSFSLGHLPLSSTQPQVEHAMKKKSQVIEGSLKYSAFPLAAPFYTAIFPLFLTVKISGFELRKE